MGSEEEETGQVPTLPLFSSAAMESPERAGTLTPPIQKSGSVPFRWEEEPGKPRLADSVSASKRLELPPRLVLLDGRRCESSSFRLMMSKQCYGSLSPERVQGIRKRWLGSWRRRAFRGKRDQVGIGGLVFPSCVDRETEISGLEIATFRRNGSFSSLSEPKPCFWASVCEGLKQVIVPWRRKKMKREGHLSFSADSS